MFVLKGGTVYTITQGVIHNGTIVVKNGKIQAVGKEVAVPPETKVIDVSGKFIMPGMIDCHTHLGIAVESVGNYGNDKNEIYQAVCPHLRAIDAINPEDAGLRDAVNGGITSVIITPGSENVIGGQSVALKTYGSIIDNMILRQPAGIKVAFGENPKRVHAQQQSVPSTRMGIAALLRENLVKAQYYLEKYEKAKLHPDEPFECDLKLEALAGVLKKQYPLRAHAHQADDMMTAIRIADEFKIPITMEHATEGHKIADELAKRQIPALVGPSITARVKVELKERSYKTPAVLAAAGVKVALVTDHPILPVNSLRIEAALAIADGLSEQEALCAVTINAAEIMGVADRVGSLDTGKDADIVIWSGHPFAIGSIVERVFIDGQEVFRLKA